jgi:hypothetical protein
VWGSQKKRSGAEQRQLLHTELPKEEEKMKLNCRPVAQEPPLLTGWQSGVLSKK